VRRILVTGVGTGDLATVLGTNTLGVHRVCEAFLPLLDPEAGRIAALHRDLSRSRRPQRPFMIVTKIQA
jgi:hypothetical protein